MKSAQETQAKTAENRGNLGDFGTNVTRGVVISGMSETTKRALGADLIDLSVPWSRRIDPTHLVAAPVDQQALRASRLTTEGGAERETINSPPENRSACTGRKNGLWKVLLCTAIMVLALANIWMAGGLAAFMSAISLIFPAQELRIACASVEEGA